MDTESDRFRNPQCPIHSPAGLCVVEHDNAGLVEEQTTEKVVAHLPKLA